MRRRNRVFLLALVLALAPSAPGFGQTICDDGPYGLPGPQGPPEEIGVWSAVEAWPFQATHSALLHTGLVLIWRDGHPVGDATEAFLWDPETNALYPRRTPGQEIFCGGQAQMCDGRLMVAGGTLPIGIGWGPKDVVAFHPEWEAWQVLPDMAYGRYYAKVTPLPDCRILVADGQITNIDPPLFATKPEVFDVDSNTWTALTGADLGIPQFYPMHFVAPNGDVFYAGTRRATRILNVDTETWTNLGYANFGSGSGTSATYEPGKVFKTGGAATGTEPPTQRAEVIDLNDADPQWREVPSMAFPRARADAVLLPDGSVLVVGGGNVTSPLQATPECAVYPPEHWDPVTETFTQWAALARPRLYHSTALLLPDGRILAAGGENESLEHDPSDGGETNFEVLSPPYLFQGPRPVVTAAPQRIAYGAIFPVDTPDGASVVKVGLNRPGATTHNFDHDQRHVSLSFAASSGGLDVTAPSDANQAPPGWYMLFLINANGVPSVAEFLYLGEACTATESPETSCADLIDNDCDGMKDAIDPDCGPPPGTPGDPVELIVRDYDAATGDIAIDYRPGCAAQDHTIVFGDLGQVSSYGYSGQVCNIGRSGSYEQLDPGAGSAFFLVVANNGASTEGSYGKASGDLERPPFGAAPSCQYTQDLSQRCDEEIPEH